MLEAPQHAVERGELGSLDCRIAAPRIDGAFALAVLDLPRPAIAAREHHDEEAIEGSVFVAAVTYREAERERPCCNPRSSADNRGGRPFGDPASGL